MGWFDWLIAIIPVIGILCLAIYSRRYVHGVVDFVAAGRVAGRYVISVGDLTAGLSVLTLVALVESKYQVGYALTFWEYLVIPVGFIMALTGYCTYRFRETKSLSIGQFLEMRYSRSFRIVAAMIRTLAEMLANSIGPAIAANFFIYFLGLPHKVMIFGIALPTFSLLVGLVLCMAIVVMWPGGRVGLLISDSFQGLISYPIFIIIAGYIFFHFSWGNDIAPVMMDRVPNESFLNPFDVSELRDFNIFALFVTIFASVINKASWIGNDTTSCGRTPHEQKMAGILGAWRTGFSGLMCLLIAVMIITVMTHERFSDQAHAIRQQLSQKVSDETVTSAELKDNLDRRISDIGEQRHHIGIDPELSRENNLDTVYLETAREALGGDGAGNYNFQKYRTLYNQMMMPVALRSMLPTGLMGLFCLLMIMLMLSTDDSRIFNSSTTIAQDVILPLLKKPPSPKRHLLILRVTSVCVAVFFFGASMLFVQLDYINMFITIICAVWLGGAGPVMIFGLYSRFGTTFGAYCALLFGSGFSILGYFLQRYWAESIYPLLEQHGWSEPCGRMLEMMSSPFHPYVVWEMNPVKFPINSYELYFLAMLMGIAAYIAGSLITYRKPYNLDRLLHRGEYNLDETKDIRSPWTWKSVWGKLIGITPDYTKGDKIIAWAVFGYAFVYQIGICFLLVIVWNLFSPWPMEWWSTYFYVTSLVVSAVLALISTVWFFIGGVIDIKRLFKDLAARVDNPLDDGRVEGHVSLMDKATFETKTHQQQED